MIDKVFNDNILLKEVTQQKKFITGSYAKEKSQIMRVVNVGDNVKINIEIDDLLVVNKFSGTEVEIDNEVYTFVREHDVLARIKKGE